MEAWVILARVSLAVWFRWWVLFGMGQVGCGGNRRGAMVAMENWHGALCVALLLALMVALLVVLLLI